MLKKLRYVSHVLFSNFSVVCFIILLLFFFLSNCVSPPSRLLINVIYTVFGVAIYEIDTSSENRQGSVFESIFIYLFFFWISRILRSICDTMEETCPCFCQLILAYALSTYVHNSIVKQKKNKKITSVFNIIFNKKNPPILQRNKRTFIWIVKLLGCYRNLLLLVPICFLLRHIFYDRIIL